MNRGEVWRYQPVITRPGQSLLRLIVSSDDVNTSRAARRRFIGLHVIDADPGELLAVAIGAHGWASALTIEIVLPSRLHELVGRVSAAEMEQVDNALRAALDL